MFEGGIAQASALLIMSFRSSLSNSFLREDNVGGTLTTITMTGSQCSITGCFISSFAGATARGIDVPGVVSQVQITGNTFGAYASESIQMAGSNCQVTGNANCKVTELAGADQNTYANNTDFTGSTILAVSTLTRVEEARRQVTTAAITADALTAVFTHLNPKGLAGAGSIKNTGANSLRVRRTGTDGYGTTDFMEDVVLAGATFVWPMDTALTTALPEFVSFTVSVRSEVAGLSTTFDLRHTSHGALI
jgi:hypothetical protein